MVRKTIMIDEDLAKDLDHFARKEQRDFSGAMRYALRIGLLAIENPELTIQEIKDILEAMVDYEIGNVSELNFKNFQMRLVETSKFKRLRKKLKQQQERVVLKNAIKNVVENPYSGKKLKGELRELLSFSYSVKGQSRRLIYKTEKDTIILFSFGPREGIYK